MQRYLFPVFVVLTIGISVGFALPMLLAAALVAAAVQRLYLRRFRRKNLCWSVALAPEGPDAKVLATAICEAVDTALSLGKRIALRISIPKNAQNIRFSLRAAKPMDLVVEQAGARPRALCIGKRWIPDLPIPLALPMPGHVVLSFRPAESARVRVELAEPSRIPVPVCISLLFAAICGYAFGVPLVAAVCVSVCIGLLWLPKTKFCC